MELPQKTEYYSSEPLQIRALRHAIGWSRYDLGKHVGLYTQKVSRRPHGKKYGICKTIANWETGKTRPMRTFKIQLTRLVTLYKNEYLEKLAELQREGKYDEFNPSSGA